MTIHSPEVLERTVDQVRALIRSGHYAAAAERLRELHPADRAEVVLRLPEDEREDLVAHLDVETAAELFEELDEEIAADLADDIHPERLADILDEMEPDDAADLLGDLPPELVQTLLDEMEEAAEVEPLLQYPDETAGGLMTTAFVALQQDATADDVIAFLRALKQQDADEDVDIPFYLFVIDDQQRLVGVVDLRELVAAPPHTRIGDLMDPQVIAVDAWTDQEEVARVMKKYDLAAVPVVDDQRRLVGVVTYDDIMHVLEEEAGEDFLHMGGVESEPLAEKPYWEQRLWEIFRSRFPWLLLLFVAGSYTGSVLRMFDAELRKVISLSIFIPLIIGTGGNVGSQTVATVIRALVLKEVRPRDALRAWWREVRVAVLLGVAIGALGFVRAALWGVDPHVAWAVSLTIFAVILWASTVATFIPLVASAVGIDPTHISGPLMSTLIDGTGLMIYFLIARAVIPEL